MLFQNPEFKKNLLLEVNPTRLIVCFGLLLLIAGTLHFPHSNLGSDLSFETNYGDVAVEANANMTSAEYSHAKDFFAWFCGIGFFFSILWGTYLSASSISDELRQKTWDFVRMSSLSPFKILTGKLFGATSLIWIVSLIGILPLLAYQALQILPDDSLPRSQYTTLGVFVLALALWIIASHAAGLLATLHASLLDGVRERANNILVTLGVTVAGFFIGAGLLLGFNDLHHAPPSSINKNPAVHASSVNWYQYKFYILDITAICLAVGAFWVVVGAYRTLRTSLQFRDLPLAWVLFLITSSVFLNGFMPLGYSKLHLFWPIVLSAGTLVIMAFSECRDIVRYKTFWARFESGQKLDALRYLPLWIISFLGLIVTLTVGIFIVPAEVREAVVVTYISIICVIIRDLLVLHSIAWKPNVKRHLIGYIVYAFVIYTLLPALFQGSNLFGPILPNSLGRIDTSEALSYWMTQGASLLVAGFLFYRRWNNAFKNEETPKLTPSTEK